MSTHGSSNTFLARPDFKSKLNNPSYVPTNEKDSDTLCEAKKIQKERALIGSTLSSSMTLICVHPMTLICVHPMSPLGFTFASIDQRESLAASSNLATPSPPFPSP